MDQGAAWSHLCSRGITRAVFPHLYCLFGEMDRESRQRPGPTVLKFDGSTGPGLLAGVNSAALINRSRGNKVTL